MDVKNQFGAVAVTVLLSATLAFGASATAEKPSTSPTAKVQNTSHNAHHAGKKARKRRVRGQKAIDGDRVRQIQEALIREHYLKGEPSGKWDESTQQALHRYQSDQGWQSKTVPDSRALIRLGLGPDSEHLLNPESAMTMSAAPSVRTASRSTARLSSASMSTTSNSIPASSAQVSAPAASMSSVPTR
jgi:peptidoglycan hydrolase-like protein with peptidoglycan-binding domain